MDGEDTTLCSDVVCRQALAATPWAGDAPVARTVLQSRQQDGRGRVIERVTFASGQRVVLKWRNDRPDCRETLFYRHVLGRAGELVPQFLASTTVGDVHALVLEDVAGRQARGDADTDRRQAMAALARFHRCCSGRQACDVLGAAGLAALGAEATPDPLEDAALRTSYRAWLEELRPLLGPQAIRRAHAVAEEIAAALAASPLVLDPGDVRPENILVAGERVVLLDFENAGVRRLGVALGAMTEHFPRPNALLGQYFTSSETVLPEKAGRRAVTAGRAWLAARRLVAAMAVADADIAVRTRDFLHAVEGVHVMTTGG